MNGGRALAQDALADDLVEIRAAWEFTDLGPILAGVTGDEPPSMLRRSDDQGLMYRGKVHNLAGEPEAAKGWLAMYASAEQLSMGSHVVYCDFEDTASTAVARLRALGVSGDVLGERFHYAAPEIPPGDEIPVRLPEGTSLVVLDGLTEALTLMGLKLIDNTDVAQFLSTVARPIAAAGPAVLMLDHVVKDREARGRGAIGAQHKLAGIDVGFTLDIVRPFGRGLDGLSRLIVTKDRPGFIRAASASRKFAAEVELYSEDPDVAVVVKPTTFEEADPLGLTPAQRRVLEALPSGPPGMTPTQLGDRVVAQGWEAGLARETIQRALGVLAGLDVADRAEGRWWRTDPEGQ